MIEYIYIDGNIISSLIILIGKNLSYQWISKDIEEYFYLIINKKDWINMRIGEE
jgi:hypothetical protein